MRPSSLLRVAVAAVATLLAACSGTATQTAAKDSGPLVGACVDKRDCSTGEVCSGGVCIPGECEKTEDCPFPGPQMCAVDIFRCVPDPESPVGAECPAGDNDCDLGEFCSAGSCYSTEGRTACLRSSQCGPGDRCDARVGYCVPNKGGCDLCSVYPELCCVEGEESCDPETKRCQPIGGTQCSVSTQETDCRPGESCVDGRCVQCITDDNCGPGTVCNQATGRCVSAGTCTADEDCAQFPGRRCATATNQCTVPQCTSDSQCGGSDARMRCNLETFQCFLPPAMCTETGEPNNSLDSATELTAGTGGTYTGSATLCRGDTDYITFPVEAGKRVEVVITITPNSLGAANGIIVDLIGPGSTTPLASSTFGFSSTSKRLGANITQDGIGYVRIASGNASEEDQWTWSAEARFIEPLMCDTEPGEPNNSLAQASGSLITSNTTATRALCGDTDVDHHQFTAQPNKRVTVTLDFDEDYELDMDLLSTTGTVLDTSFDFTPPIVKSVRTGATPMDIVIRVQNDIFGPEIVDAAVYSLTITEEDLPTCNDQAQEPNNTRMEARSITPGATMGVSCDRDDEDWFTFTLARASNVDITLGFTQGVDLDLYLYNTNSSSLDSAAGSSNPEEINRTNLPAGQYWVRVNPFSSTASLYPVPYTINLVAPGYCIDDNLDSDPGNDTSTFAAPLRDLAIESLLYEGALSLCRNDDDWFRLVALGNERITATLSGLPGATVAVYQATGAGPREVGRSHSESFNGTDIVEFVSVPVDVPAGIFYVRVSGGATTEGPYNLQVRTEEDPCEGLPGSDAEPNDAPANAIAAVPGSNHGIFCPANDRDIWKIQASAGDTITATAAFDGAEGDVDLELWIPGQTNPVQTDVREDGAVSAEATVSHTVTSAGQYNVLLRRKRGEGVPLDVGQSYTLTLTGFTGGGSSSSSGGSSSGGGSSSMGGASSVGGSSSGGASSGAASAGGSSSGGVSSSMGGDSSSVGTQSSSMGAGSSSMGSASSAAASSSAGTMSSSMGAASSSAGTASSVDMGSSSMAPASSSEMGMSSSAAGMASSAAGMSSSAAGMSSSGENSSSASMM